MADRPGPRWTTHLPPLDNPAWSRQRMIHVTSLAVCPKCNTELEYEVDGHRCSRLVAIYSREQDRTIAWRCPQCAHEWPRGAMVVAVPTGNIDGTEETP